METRKLCVLAAGPLALLVAAASLAGIFVPAIYARETASWAAQAAGQDWVNLLVVAPSLAAAGALGLRGRRGALLVLGGLYVYAVYSYVLYAFCVHFNALFLVYCAALGLSVFALASLGALLLREDAASWFDRSRPQRLAGALQIAVALMFASLWLGEDVPALLRGAPPTSLAEVGLFVNPVHVLDLSLVLPALLVSGVALLRRRPLGYLLSPLLLSFAVYMALAIVGMLLFLRARGLPIEPAVSAAMGLVALCCTAALAGMLRGLHPPAGE